MTGSAGLVIDPEALRSLLGEVAEHLIALRRRLDTGVIPASYVHDSGDADAYADGVRAAAALAEPHPPTEGTDYGALLDILFGPAMTNGTIHPHPGFMAHVPSGGLVDGAVGEFVARAVNRFAGVWLAAPGYQQLEKNVIAWFCSMLGYGGTAFGSLTTGGSMANFMAIRCALTGGAQDRAVVYTSDQGHFSVVKAAVMAGLPAESVRLVRTSGCRIDLAALADAIEADRAAGRSPACVVGTAGTTNTGAVDDLAALTALCRDEGLWSHVDASFGGFFRITERGRRVLAGIEEADSIAVDAHKSLFLPHGTGALLVREAASLRAAFDIPGADYLPGMRADDGPFDLCRYGPELSREVRGLAAWLPLKARGVRAFQQTLDAKVDLALRLADELDSVPGVTVVRPHPQFLPTVVFRTADDTTTARLCAEICARGRCYVTTTEVPGHGTVVRACVLHPSTDDTVIDAFLADTRSALAALGVGG